MSDRGFITIDRKIEDWRWWNNITAMGLWLYILVTANWKDKWTDSGSELVGRGELIISQRKLAEKFGMNPRTLNRYLELFQKDGQIRLEVNHQRTKIIVINYAKYQDYLPCSTAVTTSPTTAVTASPSAEPTTHNRTNKQINKVTKEQSNTYIAEEILRYLNELTGKHYKPVESSLKDIKARLSEGFTAEQCKTVIEKKCVEWANDPEMSKYLRPTTLFAAKHFQDYLNQENVMPARRGTTNRLLELADKFYGDESRKEIEWNGNS